MQNYDCITFYKVLTIKKRDFWIFGTKFVLYVYTKANITKMRKVILALGIFLLSAGLTMAQDKKHKKDDVKTEKQQIITNTAIPANIAVPEAPATTLKPDDMAFKDLTHDFGTVPEGPDASCIFTFTNNGKEPIIIQKAQPSCGCTVPSFSSEPVPPGGTGTINVAYHTMGKPTGFQKTVSVVSNAGTKVLTIKGTVEKAPTSSVPESTSMIKTN